MDFDTILANARAYVEAAKPSASPQRKAAFANSVAYIVTGASGGFGGPTVREHVAGLMLGNRGLTYDQVVAELIKEDGLIFGPLRKEHHAFWEEQGDICFDDDPVDVAFLEGDPELN